jgi:CRISPR-associated protein (TIGR02710 family)
MAKLLIATSGTTKEPVIKAIESGNYKKVLIFTHKQVIDVAKEIKNKYPGKIIIKEISDQDDPDITFKEIDKEIKKILKTKKFLSNDIIVDFTAGTKAMVVGAAIAALMNSIPVVEYIGGYRDKTGTVINGREDVHIFSMPEIVISKYKLIIKKLFNNYEFSSIESIIKEIEENHRIKLETEPYLKFIFDLSNVYLNWDRMQYEIAMEGMGKIKIQDDLLQELPDDFVEKFNKNKAALGRTTKSKFFKILDKFAAAKRSFEKAYYHMTAEMLYSLIEFIADYILDKEYKLNKNDIDVKKAIELAKEKIDENYFETSRSKVNNKIQLPLYHSYELLKILGNKIGEHFTGSKELVGVIRMRNEAIHSNCPVTKELAKKFLEKTEEFLKLFCEKYAEDKEKDVNKLISNYEFVKI